MEIRNTRKSADLIDGRRLGTRLPHREPDWRRGGQTDDRPADVESFPKRDWPLYAFLSVT